MGGVFNFTVSEIPPPKAARTRHAADAGRHLSTPQGRIDSQNQIVRIDSAVETSTVDAATRFAEL